MLYHDLSISNSYTVNLVFLCCHFWSNSLVDSIHGGYGHEGITPLEQQYQLFASVGAIKFPITPETEAWKEKVRVDI